MKYNAVMYSEYSGDCELDEANRCFMDRVHKKGLEDWDTISTPNPYLSGNWLELENLYKGEKNLLKIIVKNKETGKQKCINIPKERENDSDIKALKVGMTVSYWAKVGLCCEMVEIMKIVDDRPHMHFPRRAGKTVIIKKCSEDIAELKREHKELEEYQERPYFLVRLDPIEGQSSGKENLERMEFPCWVVYKYRADGNHRIGMLITGFPNNKLEYQLIDMMNAVGVRDCCTLERNNSLKVLMEKYFIEVVKGESQVWRVKKFNV